MDTHTNLQYVYTQNEVGGQAGTHTIQGSGWLFGVLGAVGHPRPPNADRPKGEVPLLEASLQYGWLLGHQTSGVVLWKTEVRSDVRGVSLFVCVV